MKGKKIDFINFAIIGLIIAFAAIVIVGKQKDSRELQQVSKLVAQQSSTSNYDANSTIASESQKVVKTKVETKAETKVESPYEKLNNKEAISVLVLGDALAEGAGLKDSEKWTALLKSNLDSAYGINSTIKLSAVTDGNALSSWRNFSAQENKNKYDFVILCIGENDITSLKINEFQSIYENLIKKVKTVNPSAEVILLQESSIVFNKTVPDSIKAIGDYYAIPYLDMREAFKKSSLASAKLATNGISLTAQGSIIYSNTIFTLIKDNVAAKKTIQFPSKDLLYKTDTKYDTCNVISTTDTMSGFTAKDGAYTATAKGSSITFTTEGSILAAEIDCGINYGKVDVYVDNVLKSSLDCYYPTKLVKNVLVLDNMSVGKHVVKLVSGASNTAKATGANIGFQTIYTN